MNSSLVRWPPFAFSSSPKSFFASDSGIPSSLAIARNSSSETLPSPSVSAAASAFSASPYFLRRGRLQSSGETPIATWNSSNETLPSPSVSMALKAAFASSGVMPSWSAFAKNCSSVMWFASGDPARSSQASLVVPKAAAMRRLTSSAGTASTSTGGGVAAPFAAEPSRPPPWVNSEPEICPSPSLSSFLNISTASSSGIPFSRAAAKNSSSGNMPSPSVSAAAKSAAASLAASRAAAISSGVAFPSPLASTSFHEASASSGVIPASVAALMYSSFVTSPSPLASASAKVGGSGTPFMASFSSVTPASSAISSSLSWPVASSKSSRVSFPSSPARSLYMSFASSSPKPAFFISSKNSSSEMTPSPSLSIAFIASSPDPSLSYTARLRSSKPMPKPSRNSSSDTCPSPFWSSSLSRSAARSFGMPGSLHAASHSSAEIWPSPSVSNFGKDSEGGPYLSRARFFSSSTVTPNAFLYSFSLILPSPLLSTSFISFPASSAPEMAPSLFLSAALKPASAFPYLSSRRWRNPSSDTPNLSAHSFASMKPSPFVSRSGKRCLVSFGFRPSFFARPAHSSGSIFPSSFLSVARNAAWLVGYASSAISTRVSRSIRCTSPGSPLRSRGAIGKPFGTSHCFDVRSGFSTMHGFSAQLQKLCPPFSGLSLPEASALLTSSVYFPHATLAIAAGMCMRPKRPSSVFLQEDSMFSSIARLSSLRARPVSIAERTLSTQTSHRSFAGTYFMASLF